MKRQAIIQKLLAKLNKTDPRIIEQFSKDLKNIYREYKSSDFKDPKFPKAVLTYVGDFMDDNALSREDKMALLYEAKKNNFFNFSLNKNLERAWRLILKKWNMSNYKLEGRTSSSKDTLK